MMRALVWSGGTDFSVRALPLPAPGPDEVLMRVTAAAICGSDRHTVAGLRESPQPGILGHEGVGEIVALGAPSSCPAADVVGRPLRIGDRAVWSVVSACGQCTRCRRGHTAKCLHLRKAGHEGLDGSWPLSGSYASHVLLPAGHDVVRVDARIPDGPAAIAACAGATVMAAIDAASASGASDLAGARVLVSGVGMLGLLGIVAARAAGAAEEDILAIDPSAARRELAARAGAGRVRAPGMRSRGNVGGPDADLALEFSGTPSGVSTAIDALDVGGTAVLAGSVFPGPTVGLDPEGLVRGRRTVTGVHNYEPQHLVRAVELLSTPHAAVLRDPAVLSRPIGLDEVPAAFADPTDHLRTLVVP